MQKAQWIDWFSCADTILRHGVEAKQQQASQPRKGNGSHNATTSMPGGISVTEQWVQLLKAFISCPAGDLTRRALMTHKLWTKRHILTLGSSSVTGIPGWLRAGESHCINYGTGLKFKLSATRKGRAFIVICKTGVIYSSPAKPSTSSVEGIFYMPPSPDNGLVAKSKTRFNSFWSIASHMGEDSCLFIPSAEILGPILSVCDHIAIIQCVEVVNTLQVFTFWALLYISRR